jgi:hypothetical protein
VGAFHLISPLSVRSNTLSRQHHTRLLVITLNFDKDFSIITILNNNRYVSEAHCCHLQESCRSGQRPKRCDYRSEYGDNGKSSCENVSDIHVKPLSRNCVLQLIFSVGQSPSSEAIRFSSSQEIPRILWNRIDKCQPPVLILSQINPLPIGKPEAATAVYKILMMGMSMLETC